MTKVAIVIYVLWISSEVIVNRLKRTGVKDKQGTDKQSLALIWLTIIIAMFLGNYISATYSMPISPGRDTLYLGLLITWDR